MSDTLNHKGYLLTRNSLDKNNTTELQFWVATDVGPALLRINGEKPVLFVTAVDAPRVEEVVSRTRLNAGCKQVGLKTFAGNPVMAVYSPTIHQHYRLQDALREAGLVVYEADIRLHERYLMERFVCAGVEFNGEVIRRKGYIEYRNARLKPVEYKPNFSVLSLDIECDRSGELFSVGLSGCETEEVLMIGKPSSEEKHKMTTFILWFENEKQLLATLVQRINVLDPDVISGWNLVNFDLRILIERSKKFGVRFAIGRGGEAATWRVLRGETDKGFVWIPGRIAIDGIDALKTATYSFPSFSLENVSRTLLGRGKKVEDDVDDRLEEIRYNFAHDKPKLAAYNLEDCKLVEDIFEHTQILDFLILRSQLTGLEIDRVGGMVAAFTHLYLPRLHRGGYVAPNLKGEGGLSSPGGYVMDSRPGLYRNVLVLDFKSLYPSIIRTFMIDPMGMIEGLADPEQSIEGFRGAKFHRQNHFLPQIITDLWRQRDIAKKNNDAARSQAIKILMNSFYGVLGTNGCRFFDGRLTSSITMRGHEIMQTTRKWIEAVGYRVIYGDTDSIFVWIEHDKSSDECFEIGQSLQQRINRQWQDQLKSQFDLECQLELEFETHFTRFLMPTIRGSEAGSKKRYAGMVKNESEEKLIFKGLETVRTDWTPLAREFQNTLYEMVFRDQDPRSFISATVEQTMAGQRDDQLVYRKQLRRKLDSYVKNVPPHVRAARLADEENARNGKTLRYQHKGWISYLLTVNGPEPVEYQTSHIDYQQYVDKQLKPIADGILPFIDLDFDSIVSRQSEIF